MRKAVGHIARTLTLKATCVCVLCTAFSLPPHPLTHCSSAHSVAFRLFLYKTLLGLWLEESEYLMAPRSARATGLLMFVQLRYAHEIQRRTTQRAYPGTYRVYIQPD